MSKNTIFLILTFFFQYFFLTAQVERGAAYLPFKIEGFINADTGTILLQILHRTEYYPEGVISMEAAVENKKFTFNGKIPYPQAYTLKYGNRYYSDLIVIEPGTQSVTVNIDSAREVPRVNNQAMNEYDEEHTRAKAELNRKFAELYRNWDKLNLEYQKNIPEEIGKSLQETRQDYYNQGDSLLLVYVKRHPNSYKKLWDFIYLFSGWGYEASFDSIFLHFSDSLQNTYAGKILNKNLEIGAKLATGKTFPIMPVIDHQNVPLRDSVILANTFTLIDFWYSRCAPCFAQFPHLKATFKKYQEKGFQIVGVSTDKAKDKENWLKAIDEQELHWLQYWDRDGVESTKLSIQAFPTNFLLDSEGKILQKNISPAGLEVFLKDNLQ